MTGVVCNKSETHTKTLCVTLPWLEVQRVLASYVRKNYGDQPGYDLPPEPEKSGIKVNVLPHGSALGGDVTVTITQDLLFVRVVEPPPAVKRDPT